ncbi:unnamed protein product [Moneuplotes crassus]|uniref:Uncharacterized protein n=1 Tax=Euplotes crassus TaxID=5936 RepID=A0AAD1UEQ1_EUPCR|nr:unnamed protein product [Moneuplotes crassus]
MSFLFPTATDYKDDVLNRLYRIRNINKTLDKYKNKADNRDIKILISQNMEALKRAKKEVCIIYDPFNNANQTHKPLLSKARKLKRKKLAKQNLFLQQKGKIAIKNQNRDILLGKLETLLPNKTGKQVKVNPNLFNPFSPILPSPFAQKEKDNSYCTNLYKKIEHYTGAKRSSFKRSKMNDNSIPRDRTRLFSPLVKPDRTLDIVNHQRNNARRLLQNKSLPRGNKINESTYSLSNGRVLNPVQAIVQRAISNYSPSNFSDVKVQNLDYTIQRSRMQPNLKIKSSSPKRDADPKLSESSSIAHPHNLDHKFSEIEISIFNNKAKKKKLKQNLHKCKENARKNNNSQLRKSRNISNPKARNIVFSINKGSKQITQRKEEKDKLHGESEIDRSQVDKDKIDPIKINLSISHLATQFPKKKQIKNLYFRKKLKRRSKSRSKSKIRPKTAYREISLETNSPPPNPPHH